MEFQQQLTTRGAAVCQPDRGRTQHRAGELHQAVPVSQVDSSHVLSCAAVFQAHGWHIFTSTCRSRPAASYWCQAHYRTLGASGQRCFKSCTWVSHMQAFYGWGESTERWLSWCLSLC